MEECLGLDLVGAREALRKGDLTSKELTRAYLEAMDSLSFLNHYVTETPDRALEMASCADEKLSRGDHGLLTGIPLGVKDLFCTDGVETTAGSRILGGFVPNYESGVTERLWREGGVMLGKTNLDEFAMGSSGLTSAYGAPRNPWTREGEEGYTSPGGSSGGSAAGVAARTCLASVGTDTGGSIRQPASFTGTVGVKPTYGRCSRWGVVAYASSLDQAGPITRTVRDSAVMLEAMCGYDARDSTSSKEVVPPFESLLEKGVKGMRVGVPYDFVDIDLPEDIRKVWEEGIMSCRSAGMEIVEVKMPHSRYALPVYYIVAPAECSSNLSRYDGVRYGYRFPEVRDVEEMHEKSRTEGWGDEVRRRVLIGTYVLCAGYYDAYFTKAQKVRRLVSEDFGRAMRDCDVLLTPSSPSSAFLLDDPPEDGVAMYLNDVFTVPVNLAGYPGMNVPYCLDGLGMPLGLQLIGRPFEEDVMLRAGRVLEELSPMGSEKRRARYMAGAGD